MNIQLFRIDDRLIHGQVILGWALQMKSKEIILCDDSVKENDWEQELYLSSVPETIIPKVQSVAELAGNLKDTQQDFRFTIIVVNHPAVVEELLDLNVPLKSVNIGGIHFKEGRRKFLSYLYLNEKEEECFRRCMEWGVTFECQDIPTNKKINLASLIGKKRSG